MTTNTKKAFYATVGAPVLTAKKINEKFQEITSKLRDTDMSKEFDMWAAEGEKLFDRFTDQPVIEEWTAKLDDIEMPAQVSKLREQLDDMVENWRKNFRPEPVTVPVEEEKPAPKAAAAKTAAAKKPATKKASTTKTTAASKTAAAKKPAAAKTTAKKANTTKATTAKKPAAKKSTTTKKS